MREKLFFSKNSEFNAPNQKVISENPVNEARLIPKNMGCKNSTPNKNNIALVFYYYIVW